jgi:hypothetical protein
MRVTGVPPAMALAAAGSIAQMVRSVDIGENNPRFDCQDDGLR